MTERLKIRRMIEDAHGIDNYVFDQVGPAKVGYVPAGRFVEVEFADDDGVIHAERLWRSPERSIGTAQPPRRTKGHARGYVYDDRTNREVGFSSSYELRCIYRFLADRHVVDIEDQPPARSYFDSEGKLRWHRYDFRITMDTDEVWAVDVKPSYAVESSGIQDIQERCRPNLVGFADRDLLVTERTISLGKAWNSKQVIKARKMRDPDTCASLSEMLVDIHGTVSAYYLARQFLRFNDGLNAIWCMIYDGALIPADPNQKLVDYPWVRVRHSRLGVRT